MKISQITEAKTTVDTIEQAAEYMLNHCQPWLTAAGLHNEIYRGTNNIIPDISIQPVRNNRRPKDTPRADHNIYNALIYAAGGIANRSNSMFVTGSRSEAVEYGKIFVVIPAGEFNYTWSPKYHDWTRSFPRSHLKYLVDTKPGSQFAKDFPDVDYKRLALFFGSPKNVDFALDPKYFDKAALADTIHADLGMVDLRKAILSSNEIMVRCTRALLVHENTYIRVYQKYTELKGLP